MEITLHFRFNGLQVTGEKSLVSKVRYTRDIYRETASCKSERGKKSVESAYCIQARSRHSVCGRAKPSP